MDADVKLASPIVIIGAVVGGVVTQSVVGVIVGGVLGLIAGGAMSQYLASYKSPEQLNAEAQARYQASVGQE